MQPGCSMLLLSPAQALLLSHEPPRSMARGVRDLVYTPRRPTMRLYTKTITAITSRIWIRPPPICPTSQPRSQRITRMTTTAQRILANDMACAPFMSQGEHVGNSSPRGKKDFIPSSHHERGALLVLCDRDTMRLRRTRTFSCEKKYGHFSMDSLTDLLSPSSSEFFIRLKHLKSLLSSSLQFVYNPLRFAP